MNWVHQPPLMFPLHLTKFYVGEPLERLNCLNMAAEYVQSNKEMETRFMGLSRRLKGAYTICFPSGELTDVETTKAQFYLAIRSIIYKQTKGDAPDAEIMNRVVEEMVRNAIACTGIENIVDENKSVDLFSDEFIAELDAVKMPITKFNALLKLLRKAISSYGRTNKVKAQEFDERLRNVVEAYNSRDKLVFTSEVVADFVNDLSDQLLQILKDLQDDKASFEKLGISFEEKAFYDILVKVRDDHGFPYADEKCLVLAKKIKELVDDKAQFADWSTRDDIKNQLNMELTVLLYQNGYPPEWDEEVFEKVMEQAENFKKYLDEKEIKAFTVDEIKDDQFQTVVFRSAADINGNRLPLIVILDTSIYGMIRVLVAPKVLHDDNEAAVLKLLNTYNKQYKSFKYYVDDEGNLILDTCVLLKDDEVDGDLIYAMFDVIIRHLGESYKELMKSIWA